LLIDKLGLVCVHTERRRDSVVAYNIGLAEKCLFEDMFVIGGKFLSGLTKTASGAPRVSNFGRRLFRFEGCRRVRYQKNEKR
jgi:hypothetical protein